MIGLDDAVVAGKAGISFIPGIVEVVKKLRKSGPEPTIQRVIDQLITDTREECKKLSDETRALERSLKEMGVKPDKTLSEVYRDLNFLNFPAKFSLNRHKKNLQVIEAKLSSSVDDLVSVLICAGKVSDLESAAEISQAVRKDLDGLTDKPIGELLEIYRKTIDRWVQELM
ncbi:MAG: hypothetical protein JWN94_4061 [Betaproteobacteria bacterium]|nr:hypothetical protein [Betaproteobacteria bacterium]